MQIKDIFSGFAEVYYRPLGEKGEDALAYDFTNSELHAQAVFDGCGGAGAWKYAEFDNSTGAFIAAQSIAGLFFDWVSSLTAADLLRPDNVALAFHDAADHKLQELKSSCAPMGVAGSLVKAFPCTASIALIHREKKDEIVLTSLNAGDSRTYFMVPQQGLIQFSRDDSKGNPDALQSLKDSTPLSNLLNADKPFKIHEKQVNIKLPCAVINASDGVFGFLRSPMDFEYLLLLCILQSKTIVEFENKFESEIKRITGDDSTCIISFYGWGSFEALQGDFKGRFIYVKKLIDQMDLAGKDYALTEQTVEQLWSKYKLQTVYDEM